MRLNSTTIHIKNRLRSRIWTDEFVRKNKPTMRICENRGQPGYYRFKKRFYGLAEILTIFPDKNDRTLGYSAPAWLDGTIVVTRGKKQEHEKKLFDILNKLEKAEHRANKRKSEFSMIQTKWLSHE